MDNHLFDLDLSIDLFTAPLSPFIPPTTSLSISQDQITDPITPLSTSYWEILHHIPIRERNAGFLCVFLQYVLRDRSLYVPILSFTANRLNIHRDYRPIPRTGVLRTTGRSNEMGLTQRLGIQFAKPISQVMNCFISMGYVHAFVNGTGTYYHLLEGCPMDMIDLPDVDSLIEYVRSNVDRRANPFRLEATPRATIKAYREVEPVDIDESSLESSPSSSMDSYSTLMNDTSYFVLSPLNTDSDL
jgi:hypothetical protein